MSTASEQPITVLLADPSDLARSGLRTLLGADRRFTVIGEATAAVIAAAQRLQPDLIVLDPTRDRGLDYDLIAELCRSVPSSRVAILSLVSEPEAVRAAMRAGACAYLLKNPNHAAEFLMRALALAGRYGGIVVDPTLGGDVWRDAEPPAVHLRDEIVQNLPERERAVLEGLAAGMTESQIAAAEAISLSAVNRTVIGLQKKLQAPSLFTLALRAERLGLILEP